MEKKKPDKRPKLEIQVKKMWWDWYRTIGEKSWKTYLNKNFDKNFRVK